MTLGLSQAAVGSELGWSQAFVSRLDRNLVPNVSLLDLCLLAAVYGLEPSLSFHRIGPALRDKGHEALIARLLRLLPPAWKVAREMAFPNPGDPRWWDVLLGLPGFKLGVEAETRIRDMQALIRRMRERAAQGGVDEFLLVLSDSHHNRDLLEQLRQGLGQEFSEPQPALVRALSSGTPLASSGVILL